MILTRYLHAIYMLFTWLHHLQGTHLIFSIFFSSNLHVSKSKFGGKFTKCAGKFARKKNSSAELVELTFNISGEGLHKCNHKQLRTRQSLWNDYHSKISCVISLTVRPGSSGILLLLQYWSHSWFISVVDSIELYPV